MRVTVSSTILGTGLVGRVFLHTAVFVHGNEIESTIKTTRKLGDIDVKSELHVGSQLEHLVFGVIRHQVEARPNVGGIRTLGHKVELQRVATSSSAVGALVVGTVQSTLLGALFVGAADCGVPFVSGIAVGISGKLGQCRKKEV